MSRTRSTKDCMAIEQIYSVEISGVCNLEATCKWCPMHNRPRSRKRGLMSDETIERALHWVKKLRHNGEVLHLHNFGEPLLHPRFDEIALAFSKLMPISVSTNGVLVTEAWARRLGKVPWWSIGISPWDKDAQIRASELLTAQNIRVMYPPGVTHNWAGQAIVGDKVSMFRGCHYLQHKKGVIRWDGSLATCCISDREEDVIGHVSAEPEAVDVRSYSLCDTCHHARGA